MDKLKIKYVLSIIIDIIIVDFLVFFFLIDPFVTLPTIVQRFLPLVLFICFLVQDKIVFGQSIGKRLLGIRLVNRTKYSDKVDIQQVIIRRTLEMIYITKIFIWRLHIDISKITNTRIINKSEIHICDDKLSYIFPMKVTSNLVKQQVYASLIDLAIISWVMILYFLIGIPSIKNVISENVFRILRFVLNIIIISYFLLKDFIYRNKSFGKLKQKIEILDPDNNIPSKLQILLRNIIVLVLFPIEIILLLLKYKLICDRITYTQVSNEKPNKRHIN